MEILARLVILVGSTMIAYWVVSSEMRVRNWAPASALGIYLALFGGVSIGLLQVWNLMSPKLVDDFPGENGLLIAGLITLAVLVVFALDILGRIDIMGIVAQGSDRARASRERQ